MEINYPSDGTPKLPQFRYGPWVMPVIIIILAFSSVSTLFYQIAQDEAGVVQRLGKYVRTTRPGLHMKLPFGIETVKQINIEHRYKEEFGFRTVSAGVRTVYAGRSSAASRPSTLARRLSRQSKRSSPRRDPYLAEKLMLTGDLNAAVVEWIVEYNIKDPVQFAFRIRDPRDTLRDMSEAVMRLVVGDHTINQILTSGREEIQDEAKLKLQELLDSYQVGINITNLILQNVKPPEPVQPSFDEVNEARQEKEKVINQAWEEYNRVIPRAKGQAEQVLRSAEGYALERINRAHGDAERFLMTWKAYQEAPVVTKRRLYLEMIEKVLPTVEDKLIIDESQAGLLPLLHLNRERGGQKS